MLYYWIMQYRLITKQFLYQYNFRIINIIHRCKFQIRIQIHFKNLILLYT